MFRAAEPIFIERVTEDKKGSKQFAYINFSWRHHNSLLQKEILGNSSPLA